MADAQPIVIRIKKGTDGRTALSCTRADGSTTWQRQEGAQATFFPRHDLTHYAVETALGHREGFYGLVSAGWDFSDFGNPWPRGKLPIEASISEMIVGVLDMERRTGKRTSAEELNRTIAAYAAENALPQQRPVTEGDLARVRAKRAEMFAKWDAVPPGDALEVPFDVAQANLREEPAPSLHRKGAA
ncbi:MAG: hypothetical protein M3037_03620 [Gemmatimonadota bacterium]|nr:hypothetical protein [Gemmatimonadota bacterium]